MRRIVTLAVCCVLIGALFVARSSGFAADATPDAAASHPIVGSWEMETEFGQDSTVEHVLVTFGGDGTVIATDEDGLTWHGAWEATDDRSVAFSYVTFGSEETMPLGARFFGHAEVDETGDAFIRSSKIMSGQDDIRGTRITAQ